MSCGPPKYIPITPDAQAFFQQHKAEVLQKLNAKEATAETWTMQAVAGNMFLYKGHADGKEFHATIRRDGPPPLGVLSAEFSSSEHHGHGHHHHH